MSLRVMSDVFDINGYPVFHIDEKGNTATEDIDDGEYHHICVDQSSHSVSFTLQEGPIKEEGANGCQVEEVINFLEVYLSKLNTGNFSCRENSVAITKLQEARMWLQERTRVRTKAGVEGTSN